MNKYRLRKIKEWLAMKIVWALPRYIIMWASVRMIAHATQGEYENTIAPELGAMEVLKRWSD